MKCQIVGKGHNVFTYLFYFLPIIDNLQIFNNIDEKRNTKRSKFSNLQNCNLKLLEAFLLNNTTITKMPKLLLIIIFLSMYLSINRLIVSVLLMITGNVFLILIRHSRKYCRSQFICGYIALCFFLRWFCFVSSCCSGKLTLLISATRAPSLGVKTLWLLALIRLWMVKSSTSRFPFS